MATEARGQPMVEAIGLGRAFGSGGQAVQAISRIDMEVYRSEMVAVVGRSGSGKTTLLNLLAGLDMPTSGKVLFERKDLSRMSGEELSRLRRLKIGFVFQAFGLLPLLSAWENIELPLRISGRPRAEREALTREALSTVGLLLRAKHRPYELSGGEQQRVAIARAIVHKPPVVIADEPTAELDSVTAKSIFALLKGIVEQQKVAVIVATHDRMITDTASRVLELRDGTFVKD